MMDQLVVVLDQVNVGLPVAKAMTVALLILLVLLRYSSTCAKGKQDRKNKLPPSPPALPLIGHLHLVGALPHISLWNLAKRHGGEDFMMLRLGTVPTLVVSSPCAAQAVLRTHDQLFASRPRNICSDVLAYGPSDVGFQPYGEGSRLAKKLVTTYLLSAKKVQSYRGIREYEVVDVIKKIHDVAVTRSTVDMSELLSTFTHNIVCRAVVGQSFAAEGRDKVFRELIDTSVALLGGFNPEDFFPGLGKVVGGILTWPARRRAERLRERWNLLLDRLIDEHASEVVFVGRHHKDIGTEEKPESDFLHALMSIKEKYALTVDSIKGISAGMFAPGTDTAYLVLEFAMVELMLHQDVMVKLQAEVRRIGECQEGITEDNLTGMTYLQAVIKETLRLHPPTPLLLHLSTEDCDLDNYRVPAGTNLLVNIWAICRDPTIWDAAEEFMPERFMHKEDAIEFKGNDFRYLPFGSGRRMCPGMNFALTSIQTLLANLVYHFDWQLPDGVNGIDNAELFGLTIRRKEKLVLVPRPRGYLHQVG